MALVRGATHPLARAQDRPILLSAGYSACHWCHVMAHESFDDPETAALINRLFINIKVDREERPDLWTASTRPPISSSSSAQGGLAPDHLPRPR